MQTIILINGQGGTGKTAVSRSLLDKLSPSTYIESDALIAVNPFEVNSDLESLGISNVANVASNFFSAGYKYVIVDGMIKNQALLKEFFANLRHNPTVLFVWLEASKEVRKQRKVDRARDDADNPEWLDFLDKQVSNIEKMEVQNGEFMKIETTNLSVEKAADEILNKF